MKATIEVTHNEIFTVGLNYFRDIKFDSEVNSYGLTLSFDEENLSKLLYYLPQNHILRSRLQRAGERCFGW